MHVTCAVDALERVVQGWWIGRRFLRKSAARGLGTLLMTVLLAGVSKAQGPLLLQRDGRMISLVPYSPNILRVTMSIDRAGATGAPGYGVVAMPSAAGWTHVRDADG